MHENVADNQSRVAHSSAEKSISSRASWEPTQDVEFSREPRPCRNFICISWADLRSWVTVAQTDVLRLSHCVADTASCATH